MRDCTFTLSIDSIYGDNLPTYVLAGKCKNNRQCEEICPSDIMHINPDTNMAYNVEPDMCWECFSCVKACPEHAIEVRPYADMAPMRAEISVLRDENANSIKWNIKYRDSRTKEFEFPIRTTEWDSIPTSFAGKGKDTDLDSEALFSEIEASPHRVKEKVASKTGMVR